MVNYFLKEVDENGYIYSIDNLVVVYDINPIYQSDYLNIMIDSLHNLRDSYKNDINYWERLNVNACSKYSWYCNHVHLDDGIYLSIGHYREGIKETHSYVVFPLLKLEINPNKYFDKPVFHDLQKIINRFCVSGMLKKYDYAIDIPCKLFDVQIFNTRKEPGLHKGTRYYGQRSRDGYVKIYDKTKESNLDYSLTRVEHTFDMVKHSKEKSFTIFHVLQPDLQNINENVSKTDSVIVSLCNLLKANSIDYMDVLQGLDKRKRKKIIEALNGGYKEVTFNQEIHDKLISQVMGKFNVVPPEEEKQNSDDDFIQLDEGVTLPWED